MLEKTNHRNLIKKLSDLVDKSNLTYYTIFDVDTLTEATTIAKHLKNNLLRISKKLLLKIRNQKSDTSLSSNYDLFNSYLKKYDNGQNSNRHFIHSISCTIKNKKRHAKICINKENKLILKQKSNPRSSTPIKTAEPNENIFNYLDKIITMDGTNSKNDVEVTARETSIEKQIKSPNKFSSPDKIDIKICLKPPTLTPQTTFSLGATVSNKKQSETATKTLKTKRTSSQLLPEPKPEVSRSRKNSKITSGFIVQLDDVGGINIAEEIVKLLSNKTSESEYAATDPHDRKVVNDTSNSRKKTEKNLLALSSTLKNEDRKLSTRLNEKHLVKIFNDKLIIKKILTKIYRSKPK